MAALLTLFDIYDTLFPANERTTLPRKCPLDTYDEAKFKERFRLSKTVVRRLLSEVGLIFVRKLLFTTIHSRTAHRQSNDLAC